MNELQQISNVPLYMAINK